MRLEYGPVVPWVTFSGKHWTDERAGLDQLYALLECSLWTFVWKQSWMQSSLWHLQKISNLLLRKINHSTCMNFTVDNYIKMNVSGYWKGLSQPKISHLKWIFFRLNHLGSWRAIADSKPKLNTVFFPTDENITLICSWWTISHSSIAENVNTLENKMQELESRMAEMEQRLNQGIR